MSDLDELPYDEEHDVLAAGFRKTRKGMFSAIGWKPRKDTVRAIQEKSEERRNPPITLPKLKFLGD